MGVLWTCFGRRCHRNVGLYFEQYPAHLKLTFLKRCFEGSVCKV